MMSAENVFKLMAHETDAANRWRLSSCFYRMQDIAAKHAEEMGLGYEIMLEHDLIWVLSRMRVHFYARPDIEKEIRLSTCPRGCDKLLFYRDFEFRQDEGLIAYGVSIWPLIDVRTRKIVRPPDFAFREYLPVALTLENMPRKADMPDAQKIYDREPLYSDIDINQHMNNSRYIEWVMDVFPDETHSSGSVLDFEINYLKEIKPHEKISLFLSVNGDTSYVYGKLDSVAAFSSKIIWQ